ncbi:CPBP family intramembrane glutamic endopeptidase [Devosia sp. 2618]|uniref:CPBP family intramembrane glutamic endopeptidase n=1 Tax=Devosia sp. 2618 TaxID=3156454 RepID=UPI00339A8BFB
MRADTLRLPIAIVVTLIWVGITVFWDAWLPQIGPAHHPIADEVTNNISPNLLVASLFIAACVIAFRWSDVAFKWPERPSELRLLWLPLLYVLAFFSFTSVSGLPEPHVIAFLAINTVLVGFSEEMAFRGVLFRGLLTRLPIWPAIIVTTLLFGAVHSFNALTTGDLPAAIAQSVTAAISGLLFLAIVLRTGSILPAMLIHALWDFSNLLGTANLVTTADHAPVDPRLLLVPVLVQLPTLIYALYLLRHVGRPITPDPVAA